MSLVARHLETNGIPTVIIGSALDIVEYCGVPRFLFVDFPLGNPCGQPWDEAMQLRIVRQGVAMLEQADAPNTTQYAQEQWPGSHWKDQYMAVTDDNRAALAAAGEALRARRAKRTRRSD